MTDMNENLGLPVNETVVPKSINTLTILTFIGSGLIFLSSIYQFVSAKKSLDTMEKTINSEEFENMPGIVKKMMSPEVLEMARKAYENRVPLTLVALIGIGLCVYGAMEMRKRKMQGYYLYVIGELLPLVSTIIFLGLNAFKGFGLLGAIIPIVFVILYTMQRKYLIK